MIGLTFVVVLVVTQTGNCRRLQQVYSGQHRSRQGALDIMRVVRTLCHGTNLYLAVLDGDGWMVLQYVDEVGGGLDLAGNRD